ncbi:MULTISPECIES: DUF2059 domain-containing protein [unclassified Mesorhizobium]|uniref:DUF2059 domain-containing protein n=1 Tax=unclassified Mesorhizobium TaxID=325217 RepID=UPI00112E9982|nr:MULTISPECIES: DUF2059 domain-containing protein [unclassified Mesorhizobium]TPK31201.1 DUF2059 domain-containing protein [Mesorhizobium sp. B2-5-3]TPK58121.1 DUF2059 domain-containing protein [Mesorhizobium sp. B2-5-1]TPM05567.1 DUF2059 domain-containing protein [Mesorhizobium sp. B2-3-8]TPM11127.1 DUF2059 domain-containing protein [Mesorhizobium sp. B2-3-7]TPM54847.1 DUF2059 domain-containing protein [Mesorhizobium sp. B2-1-9]
MMLHNRVRRFSVLLAASAVLAFSSPAFSQDVTEAHLKAARAAVTAIHATDPFDNILPQAAAALESQLIQKNPDMQELIAKTISEKALALASRRADLEKEAALAYAKVFSEQELNDIATFYNSDSGKKLLESGPAVTRDLVKAADIWQNGLARDLAQQVGETLAAAAKAKAPAAPADAAAPANGAAPADGSAPADDTQN